MANTSEIPRLFPEVYNGTAYLQAQGLAAPSVHKTEPATYFDFIMYNNLRTMGNILSEQFKYWMPRPHATQTKNNLENTMRVYENMIFVLDQNPPL